MFLRGAPSACWASSWIFLRTISKTGSETQMPPGGGEGLGADCLDYIVLHEMVHLLEAKHGERFIALMERFMPRWQFVRQKLNRLPVRHADWIY